MRPKPRAGHRPEHRLRGVDHAHEVHVEHAPEELRVRLRERRRLRRSGIGDQEVDRPAVLGGDVGRHLDRGRIRHVGHQIAVRLAGRDGIAERARVAPDHRHPRPGARERLGDRKPDAAAAAGDERVSVSQRSRHLAAPPHALVASPERPCRPPPIYFKLKIILASPAAGRAQSRREGSPGRRPRMFYAKTVPRCRAVAVGFEPHGRACARATGITGEEA